MGMYAAGIFGIAEDALKTQPALRFACIEGHQKDHTGYALRDRSRDAGAGYSEADDFDKEIITENIQYSARNEADHSECRLAFVAEYIVCDTAEHHERSRKKDIESVFLCERQDSGGAPEQVHKRLDEYQAEHGHEHACGQAEQYARRCERACAVRIMGA